LRAGWVHYPGFCTRPSDADVTAKPVGIAVATMEVIAQLIGVDLTWLPCEWSSVLDAVAQRKIDIVAPTLMKLPRRLFQVSFSQELPGIDVGTNVVAHKSTAEKVKAKIRDHSLDDVLVGFVEGEIGETLHRFIVPGITDKSFPTFQKAIDA